MNETAIQRFLHTDADAIPIDDLPVIAEAWLLDLVPCEFCLFWVPRQHETDYYLLGGVEVCVECEGKFQENKQRYLAGEESSPNV
jgi:hypothetical protein